MDTKSFAVLAPASDSKSLNTLAEILAGSGDGSAVVKAETIDEAILSDAEVLVLVLPRERRPIENRDEVLSALRNRKIIGVGRGSAQLFGRLGLEIHSDFTLDDSLNRTPSINVEKTSALWQTSLQESFVAYELPPVSDPNATQKNGAPVYVDDNIAMFIPEWSHHCSVVDVIARWVAPRETHAPIVRQGNHTLVGLAAPVVSWTPQYRVFFHDLAMSVYASRLTPFRRVQWDTTPPVLCHVLLVRGIVRLRSALRIRRHYRQCRLTALMSQFLALRPSSSRAPAADNLQQRRRRREAESVLGLARVGPCQVE